MAGVNRIILIGGVGKDAEVKQIGNSTVCNFRLAVTKVWKKDGAKQEKTDWFSVSVWGPRATALGPHIKKGSQLYVEGEMTSREAEKDGHKTTYWQVDAHTIEFVGGGAAHKDKSDHGDNTEHPF